MAATYIASLTCIGFGSFFFHASLNLVGRWMDEQGITLFITFITLYSLTRLKKIHTVLFLWIYLLGNITLGLLNILDINKIPATYLIAIPIVLEIYVQLK